MTDSPEKIPIFDGHNDTLLHIHFLSEEEAKEWSFFSCNKTGHIDLPRAREGGLAGGFFAILAPSARDPDDKLSRSGLVRTDKGYSIPMAPAVSFEDARDFTLPLISTLHGLARQSDDEFIVARDIEDLRRSLQSNLFSAILHFEGAEAIDEDLTMLEVYYQAGLRSLGLVWSRPNVFAHGVPFRFPSSPDTGPGLTEAGKRLVQACNEMGIMLDLAHLNEEGFWDVVDHSDKPLVVTHACCHQICPSARNLTDAQIDAIGASGGVMGINFFIGDVREDGAFERDTKLEQIVRHIDHVVDRIGIDHVAFGSDFDGARVPFDLDDTSHLQNLIGVLREAGYDDQALRKIAQENWFRVLEATWK